MSAEARGADHPRKRLTPEAQELAARYMPFARKLARPLIDALPAYADDIEAEAFLGLVEAAGAFDPTRGVRFATFAALRIKGSIRDYLRRLAPLGYRRDPDAAPVVEPLEDHGGELVETAPPIDAAVERHDQVVTVLELLPGRHRRAVELTYLQDLRQPAVARALGCSSSTVARLMCESRALMRAAV